MQNRFDTPAHLEADIEAECLDGAPNDYEAGLRPEFIGRLQNVIVHKYDLTVEEKVGGSIGWINWEKISTVYTEQQIERFKACVTVQPRDGNAN